MGFERILENKEWSWDYQGVYTYPHIPMKKLSGAISSYAPNVEPGDVLVLLDDTVFGGARDGMIVTRDGLYAKRPFEDRQYIHFKNIREVKPDTSSRIRVNGNLFFKADIIHHFAMLALAGRLNSLLGSDTAGGAGPADALSRELMKIHGWALQSLSRRMDEEFDMAALDVPGLIDAHFRRMLQEWPKIARNAMNSAQRSATAKGQQTDMVIGVLLGFVVFHASAFARTPDFIKNDLGDSFFFFAGIHAEYRDFFIEGVNRSIGPIDREMKEFLEIAAMLFMVKDGDTDYQLKIPREEAITRMVEMLGLSPTDRRRIDQDFDETLHRWWLHVEQLALEDEEEGEEYEDEDEGEEDGYDHGQHRAGGSGSSRSSGAARHAEVLGVRPGASVNEIELAYRGRRSQYHPDRYASEGQEAINWATEKMKEVNVAYQALIESAG